MAKYASRRRVKFTRLEIEADQVDIKGTNGLLVNGTAFVALSALGVLTAAEVGYLDGATAGSVVASKALVADANSNAGSVKVTGISIGTSGSETAVTATAAELNYLDIAALGTGAASKAVVLDGSSNYTSPAAGTITFSSGGTVNIAGTFQVGAAAVTATAAELNLLDQTAQDETIDSGVAVSIVKRVTHIDNTTSGAGAITLAAPGADMMGQVKVIEMTVNNGNVTLALTNVTGGSAATTCTWSAINQALILVGGTNKWHVIAESGVALT